MTALHLTRSTPDPDAQRRAAEERVRLLLGELGEALIDLAAVRAAPAQRSPVELLDVRTFAARCHIARSTLYQQLATGAIASVLISPGRRLIPSTELDRIAAAATPKRLHTGQGRGH